MLSLRHVIAYVFQPHKTRVMNFENEDNRDDYEALLAVSQRFIYLAIFLLETQFLRVLTRYNFLLSYFNGIYFNVKALQHHYWYISIIICK